MAAALLPSLSGPSRIYTPSHRPYASKLLLNLVPMISDSAVRV